MRNVEKFEAHLDDYKVITIYLSRQFYQGRSETFFLRDRAGKLVKLPIQGFELTSGDNNKYTLAAPETIIIGDEYHVVEEHSLSTPLQYSLIVKSLRFDDEFYYEGDDLGVRTFEKHTDFALWAPTANRVMLEVYVDDVKEVREMKRSEKGVFRHRLNRNLHGCGYLYHLLVNGKWNQASDPIARSSFANNRMSAIIDYTQTEIDNFSKNLPEFKHQTDAVIYELSVRDFSMMKEGNIPDQGKFLAFTHENTKTDAGYSTGITYLKELGITHVQIMPMFDFATVDELNIQAFYNWGYDPLQYNVPEGSFTTQPDQPVLRVIEAKKMVQAFHSQGIRVNMDVVYNHVYDMDTSPFENVVPYYYFRRSATGSLSNGSFCNNDIDSNRRMVRKFILDSCKCWMEAYDIDGFRFDLMGVLDVVTMNEVLAQSRKLKPDAMIYGEGWDMPTLLDESLKANMGNQTRMPQIGHFNDFFRENVKGKTSPNEISARGYCSGDTSFLSTMHSAMIGNCLNDEKVKLFDEPFQSVNYVECHDNSTSWDKLKECCREDQREVRIRKQKLMIATILVSQGIPFIHSGQEFCRTKSGNHNSYRSNDPLNQLDWLRRERYDEVVRYTRDLIQLRKKIPAFRLTSADEISKHVMFSSLDNKMLIYHLHHLKDGDYASIFVYINPTSQVFYQNFPDYVDLLANEAGMIKEYSVQSVVINPYTMVIVGVKKVIRKE